MHRLLYTVSFAAVAVTAAQDLFALLAHASSRIAICRAEVWQTSDFGDAQAEILAYTFKRGATVAGSAGTAATPVNVKAWGRAAVTTARVNDTVQAGTGTIVTVLAGGFNVAAGLVYAPKFGADNHIDERITVEQGQRLVLSLDGTPADSVTMSGSITFEELGLTG